MASLLFSGYHDFIHNYIARELVLMFITLLLLANDEDNFVENRTSHFSKDFAVSSVFYTIGKNLYLRWWWTVEPGSITVSPHQKPWLLYIHGLWFQQHYRTCLLYLRKENNCVHCYSAPSKAPQCLVVDFYLSKLSLVSKHFRKTSCTASQSWRHLWRVPGTMQ